MLFRAVLNHFQIRLLSRSYQAQKEKGDRNKSRTLGSRLKLCSALVCTQTIVPGLKLVTWHTIRNWLHVPYQFVCWSSVNTLQVNRRNSTGIHRKHQHTEQCVGRSEWRVYFAAHART